MSKYVPSLHAIERAQHRLGVDPTKAERWFNDIMRKAKYLYTQRSSNGGRAVYEAEDLQIIIAPDSKTVITIKPTLDTSFLKPVFEREERRIKREVVRNTRRHELAIAELTVEMGERMTARAKAKNPQTRDIIQRDIDELQAKIEKCYAAITREQDRLENFVRATGVYA